MHRVWATAMRVVRYTVANVPVIVATALCTYWRHAWGDRAPLLAYVLAIGLAALACGAGPALLATLTSVIAVAYYFLPPHHDFVVGRTIDQVHLLLLAANGGLIALTSRYVRCLRLRDALDALRVRELEQANETRQALHAQFRAVFELPLLPLTMMRRNGDVVEANDAWLRLVGTTREQVGAGEVNCIALTTPEFGATIERSVEAVKATGRFGPVEKAYRKPDGNRVPVLVGGSVVPDDGSDLLMVFAVDLSEQKRTEAALRASEARLLRLWEANIIGVTHSSASGAILDANDAFLRMLGFSREDLQAGRLSWRETTPEEHIDRDDRAIAEALERGTCTPYEKTYIGKDGRRVPALLGFALLEGSQSEFICFTIDLTAQKRAEAALADQITKAITDHASDALFMIDVKDGRCTFMNPAAEAMTGFSLADIDHRPLHDVIHHHRADGAPYPRSECELARAAEATEGLIEGREEVYFRRSGERFPALCTARRIDRPGHAPRVLLEVRDITEVKRAAAEREMLLESERAARAEAERASRAKDEFVAVMSHELRTPLNAVLGWADIALRRGQSDEQRDKALRVVARNARLLAQIMADILDVSRISSGKLHIERVPIDLSAVTLAAVDSVRSAAEAKGVELVSSIDSRGCVVLGDAPRLQQVMWNLLSNAIKFTPREGRVGVSVEANRSAIRIVVRDDGQGIEPAFLPQLFERFRQADASASRAQGGLGLGLSIVKHLVDLHGGTVRAESAGLGQGSTFTVALAREASPVALDADALPVGPFTELVDAHVLVVDDEDDARELVRRLLEERGASVWTAASAAEALALLATQPIDAMVSDIGMPGVDGYELMRRVRRGARSVPAVALTAYARPEDAARALEAGYRAHLAKPFDPSKMLAAVAEMLAIIEER